MIDVGVKLELFFSEAFDLRHEIKETSTHAEAETFAQNGEEVRSISKDEYFLDKNESFPQLELSLRAHCDGHRS